MNLYDSNGSGDEETVISRTELKPVDIETITSLRGEGEWTIE